VTSTGPFPVTAKKAVSLKIILSGRSSRNLCSRVPVTGLLVLVYARLLAGQPPDLQRHNAAGVNGKEKVYGSIP
jgi:hypothetical protein